MSEDRPGEAVQAPSESWIRRMLRRWMRRLIVALVATLLVYIVLAVRFYTGRPNLARNFSAEFNATFAAVPEAERAWTVYREAVLSLPLEVDWLDDELLMSWPEVPVAGPRSERVLEYLAAAEDTITLVHKAAAVPVLGREVTDVIDPVLEQRRVAAGRPPHPDGATAPSPNPHVSELMLDHLGSMRGLARLLRADTRRAAVQGDAERVCANIVAILGMAEHADQSYGMISQLSAFSICGVAITSLAEAVSVNPGLLSAEQLDDLADRLLGFGGGGRPTLRLQSDREMFHDFAQRLFTDNGAGDGRVCFAGLQQLSEITGDRPSLGAYIYGPYNAVRYGSRRQFLAECDRIISQFEADTLAPIWLQDSEAINGVYGIGNSPDTTVAHKLVGLVIPALWKAARAAEELRLRRDAAVVGVAAELHRRRTGAYPSEAADFEPLFPSGLPPDWIDGQPLRYTVQDGRFVVYSLGPDADDDGGRRPEGDMASELLKHPRHDGHEGPFADGDLVLWPLLPTSLGME